MTSRSMRWRSPRRALVCFEVTLRCLSSEHHDARLSSYRHEPADLHGYFGLKWERLVVERAKRDRLRIEHDMRTRPGVEIEVSGKAPDVTAADGEHGAGPARGPRDVIVLDAELPNLAARAHPESVEMRSERVVDDGCECGRRRAAESLRGERERFRGLEMRANETDARMPYPKPNLPFAALRTVGKRSRLKPSAMGLAGTLVSSAQTVRGDANVAQTPTANQAIRKLIRWEVQVRGRKARSLPTA